MKANKKLVLTSRGEWAGELDKSVDESRDVGRKRGANAHARQGAEAARAPLQCEARTL